MFSIVSIIFNALGKRKLCANRSDFARLFLGVDGRLVFSTCLTCLIRMTLFNKFVIYMQLERKFLSQNYLLCLTVLQYNLLRKST